MFVTFRYLGRLGRLGNQLFQIASVIGVARSSGCDFLLPPWPYARHFARSVPQSNRNPVVAQYVEQSFTYQEIVVRESVNLVGFFQSERYFKHCEPEIRGLFAPHPRLAEYVESKFGRLLQEETCSLHVRRTDYVGHPNYVDVDGLGHYDAAWSRPIAAACCTDDRHSRSTWLYLPTQ